MGGDFAEEQVGLHINVKEAVALEASLRLFCEKINEKIKGKIVVVNVDNQVLFHIYEKGGSTRQEDITKICKQLFWLQVKSQFKLALRWIPSMENEADGITRDEVDDDIRLQDTRFKLVRQTWGGFFRDLMASSENAQRGMDGEKLPFFSRYLDTDPIGVDVFSQNITRGEEAKHPDYCFPPFGMITEFLHFAEKSRAWCVVILPEMKGVWIHMTVMAKRRELHLAERNQKGTLVKFRRNALRSFSSKYATVAIELDFR